ncbi:MAG: alkaline phosphatase family protein [Kofleriaceae bacterium]
MKWLVLLAVAACSPNDSGSTFATCDKLVPVPAKAPDGYHGTVFTIALENHSRSQILGNKHAPYINQLAKRGAIATGYHDPYVHPSEANYLWMVSGENFGVLDDEDPAVHSLESTSHLADQIEMAGLTWKSYQESMGAPCGLRSHGRYAAKHDPFVFFNDVNGWDGTEFQRSERCIDHVVDYTTLDRDIANGTVPAYAFITPNLDDDMHDGSVAEGDAWLSREVPKILASDAYQKGGVLFILWDEGGGTPARDDPPFIALSPNIEAGTVSKKDYDTSSYLKTVEAILGLGMLPCDNTRAGVATMDDLFAKPIHGEVAAR